MKSLWTGTLFLMSGLLFPLKSEEGTYLNLLKETGHFALIRHALAPGAGDPSAFTLDDCSTQRNLSKIGRKQAQAMGNLFRKAGISEAEIFSSQWCRCRETAELFQLGEVTVLPSLNSFFGRPTNKKKQLEALHEWLKERENSKPTLVVTHQVVITALTKIFPASGEIVVIKVNSDGGIEVRGRIQTL